MSESDQVLTYLVRIPTFGKRVKVKRDVGRTPARVLGHLFHNAEVWFVSKADVPDRKPYEPAEIASGLAVDE